MPRVSHSPASRTHENYSYEERQVENRNPRDRRSHEVDPPRSSRNLQNLESNSRRQADLSEDDWNELEEGLEDQGGDEWDGVDENNYSSEDAGEVSENRRRLSPSEMKKELQKIRKELDKVRSELRQSALDSNTKNDLLDQINDTYQAIAQGGDVEELRSMVEGIRDQLNGRNLTGTTRETSEQVSPEDKQAFQNEIQEAKADFKQKLEGVTQLSSDERQTLIQQFNAKADALANRSDLDRAREELSNLSAEFQKQLETVLVEKDQRITAEREELHQVLLTVTDEPKFKENNGHWRHVGWRAGELFETAIQTGNWSDFSSFISGLREGDQRFVPIMRLITALYRTAGKDEQKAFKMINHFIPKEVVQTLINKVTEASENLDWQGQAWPDNEHQVGADVWHEWTPRGTSDFLRRSLEARRDFDPYAVYSRPTE